MSLLRVSAPPHIHTPNDTSAIMADVIIAIMPAVIAGAYYFGYRAVMVVVACVLTSVLFEYLWTKIMKQAPTIGDLSAVVSGLLLGLNLPPSAPFWMCAAGSFFMMIIVKAFFGGLGQNFLNPALAARAFLMASWPTYMTRFTAPFTKLAPFGNADAVTSPTVLTIMKNGLPNELPSKLSMFLGNMGGCIGETSALAILIGFAYLLVRGVISWRIPVTYTAVLGLLTLISGGDPILAILSGGLLLGAVFMATDYTTSPVTHTGQFIYAAGCGFIAFVIRKWGGYPEGVSYSILLMNIVTPLIDRATPPRAFGRRAVK